MALSETNIEKVCTILGIVTPVLNQQLTLMGSSFTSTKQTLVEAQITLWDAGAATNFTNIEPNVKNFGAKISAGAARSAIRNNIAVLLERTDWGSGSSRLQRG